MATTPPTSPLVGDTVSANSANEERRRRIERRAQVFLLGEGPGQSVAMDPSTLEEVRRLGRLPDSDRDGQARECVAPTCGTAVVPGLGVCAYHLDHLVDQDPVMGRPIVFDPEPGQPELPAMDPCETPRGRRLRLVPKEE